MNGDTRISAQELSQRISAAKQAGGVIYLVTGASSLLGSFIIAELLTRKSNSLVLALTSPSARITLLNKIRQRCGESNSDRFLPLNARLNSVGLGLEQSIADLLTGNNVQNQEDEEKDATPISVDHFFHLASLAECADTAHMIDFASMLHSAWNTRFHLMSTLAVAGDHEGVWFEDALDEGQTFSDPSAQRAFEAEKLARASFKGDLRVYRPGIIVGSSLSGEADEIDGLYHFFKPIQNASKMLPSSAVLPFLGGNKVPIVPVDYVARAMAFIAHSDAPNHRSKTFHLVDPSPMSAIEVMNTLAAAAGAPGFSASVPKLLQSLANTKFLDRIAKIPILAQMPAVVAKNFFEIPEQALACMAIKSSYDDCESRAALGGTDIHCPHFDRYAWRLWDYYVRFMDPGRSKTTALETAVRGKTVMITGASDGIGKMLALRLGKTGAHVLLVARSIEKLEAVRDEIEANGGTADVFVADLAQDESTYAMLDKVNAKYKAVDILVNNAGRSIRRSVEYQTRDRFHDFERLMQLNYYGSMRVTLDLLPGMRAQKQGHIINIGSIAQRGCAGRFSAYVGSKAALTEAMKCIASETATENIKVSTVYMPLVRTKMIALPGTTRTYFDHMEILSPEQASEMIERAIVTKEASIDSTTGRMYAWSYWLAPSLGHCYSNGLYRMEPELPPKGKAPTLRASGDVAQLRAYQDIFDQA
ncbi:Dehydrogenase/reductase SDR family protein 7-like [Hondaea fermentalgiana]|uniref:Dehydrogenase/reductase SDR family protein 7-like n=1 Tax=Hondaea fermentalgiana TaxID=2315210 RepID=A0A2R5GHK5_9STRA|nr:Dehydrogenase/reductase SDR family protein 7-like [Hondaea fermentalgiana]|eukprot:GBG30377.1 Dehydrogenase/reductase SDR family protein 7-like [Hondaea fermentalgiana]